MTVQAAAETPSTPTPGSGAAVTPNPSPTGDAGAEGQEKGEEGQKPRRDGAQRAIDRQTRKYYEERAQRIAAEKELERYRSGEAGGKPAAPAADPDAEPDEADFQDPKEYTKAVAKWAAKEALRDKSNNENRSKSQAKAQELEEAFGEREDSYKETSEGYEDAMENLKDARVKFAPTAIEFIYEEENGPAILEALGNDVKEAKRIAALSPARQVAALTRLQDKLPAAAAKPKKVSGAPEPVSPVKNRASVEKSRDELSDDEWLKRRKAEKTKK